MMAIAAVSRANLDAIITTVSLRSSITARRIILLSRIAQQLRQLGDIRRDPPGGFQEQTTNRETNQ
jgi:hypothetical protein